jgi:membrane protein DedA with SNARE-associated domain
MEIRANGTCLLYHKFREKSLLSATGRRNHLDCRGLRTVTSFAFGLSGISTSRFLILNMIGALVWAVVVALVGYLFGAAARAVIVDVKKYEHWIILAILWTGALVYIINFLHKRETERMEGRP